MTTNNKRLPWVKFALGALLIAAIVGLAIHFLAPMADWEGLVEAWVEASGVFGVLVLAAIFVVATLLLLPAAVLNIAAGALFGLAWGVGVVMAASMVAALLAFLIARHLLRERIKKHYTRS